MTNEKWIVRARVTEEDFNFLLLLGRGNMSVGIRKAIANMDIERQKVFDKSLDELIAAADNLKGIRQK